MERRTNAILGGLPHKTLAEITPQLVAVTLAFGDVLYEPGQPMRDVYFPEGSIVSLLVVLEHGLALEVALAGNEGFVGVPLALGTKVSPVRALVQGAGAAWRMSGTQFIAAMGHHPSLQRTVYRYAGVLMGQIALTAACNRFHLLEPRLARWLLMTRDRLQSAEFRMTQEFLSTMLGVRRVGVGEAAASFQRQNLISYTRGRISILDHDGLEAASCTCYLRGTAAPSAAQPWRPLPGAL